MSNQYEAIRQQDNSTSTIVNRNASAVDEETRPARRRKDRPDPETFGKQRSSAEVKESNRKADEELELGELDVDFA